MAKNVGKRSVATAMAQTMKAYGVRFVFGIPGNDVLELIRACEATGIRFILAKSEPSAWAQESLALDRWVKISKSTINSILALISTQEEKA